MILWTMMEHRANRFSPACGLLMLLWRLGLTTGTGLIFGFLAAREAYDDAVMGPLFIAMSFSFGMAVFILVLISVCGAGATHLGDQLIDRLGRLLGVFAAAVLYFVLVQHLTNLYAAEHTGVESFILAGGGVITWAFWGGQVVIGGMLPLALLLPGGTPPKGRVCLAALLVIAGGLAQLYVIIIGGQAYPLDLFPGLEERSGFFDGVVNAYSPSLPEIAIGVGGAALAAVIVMVGIRTLRFLPDSLSDTQSGAELAE
jgi:molybdopterin-containing oxidoreductase family membrane subunit